MKKTISLLLALVMCLPLCACGGSSEPTEVELDAYNFEEYLSVTFEVKNFDEGHLDPAGTVFRPELDLLVTVKAIDPEYKFSGTVLKLTIHDEANPMNHRQTIEIVIDENGNGAVLLEGISWTTNAVSRPKYKILTAVSEVSGTAILE